MPRRKRPSEQKRVSQPGPAMPGEAGPLQRAEGLLEQRLAVLRPRGAVPREPSVMPRPDVPSAKMGEGPLPFDFRQRLMADYRQRQGEQLPPAARRERGAGKRGPALPPPANNWIPIGPSVVRQGQAANRPAVSGRVTGLAIAPAATRVYAGSANGGVWRSDDAGLTWHSTMEAWDLNPTIQASDSLACGAIAIDPADPDRIYVGTGEAFGALDSYFGVGPIRSDDGGLNWIQEPTAATSPSLVGTGFYRLAVDPGDRERVVAATRLGLYRREPDGGPGFHWARKQSSTFTCVVAARTGSTTTFYAARQGGGIYSSSDGHTWSTVGSGFPTSNVGRVGLAVQVNNPTVVYALVVNSSNAHILGVWRLDTSDNTWRQISGAPSDLFGSDPGGYGQGWYDVAIALDPNNVNRVYLGGSTKEAGGQWAGCIYRCTVSSSGSGSSLSYSMAPTFVGANVHADVHALEFTPGDSDKLWVGCDGGVFYTASATGTASFESRNVGLATLAMNHLAQHPSEDALLFCGTQDNGTTRYTGEEAWLHSGPGDGGFVVINWNDPYRVLRTYVQGYIYRATDGGQSYSSWAWVGLPTPHRDNALFYAPLSGTPPNPAMPAEADIVAFGGRRPWISSNFGSSWSSIPNNNSTDDLPSMILSLAFASATRLYAGTTGGDVYRLDKSGAAWTRTQIDTLGGANALPLNGPITDIAVDPADATGGSVYITFGGINDYRHIWHFNGSSWQQRSGPSAGSTHSLLDVQHNALVVDPSHATHLYAGADIGVWRSTDSGANWAPFADGLPDAAVLDLNLHNGRRLLWAATHGRGVYERCLDTETALGVELYVRDTQLDRGRRPTVNGLNDPTQPGQAVYHWKGPDIKLDVPSSTGSFQTPNDQINFYQFTDAIVDGSGGVATLDPTAGVVHNRVYVQVHNRGVLPADNVQVMLLLANASAGLPNLPTGYQSQVQSGTPISTAHWQTVGLRTLNGLQVGLPQIAAFDLPSNLLPPPASLAGNAHHCLLALLHSPDDPFANSETVVDWLSPGERKAAHKNLHVVPFTGPVPPPAPAWAALRLHGRWEHPLLCDLVLELQGYAGRVALLVPRDLKLQQSLDESLDGLRQEDPVGVEEWAKEQQARLKRYQEGKLFNPVWCKEMSEAIAKVRGQPMLVAEASQKLVRLRRFEIPANTFYTVFLAIHAPKEARIGDTFGFTVYQQEAEKRQVWGGSTYQVQIVPKPDVEEKLALKVWGRRALFFGWETVYVRVTDEHGKILGPEQGAQVGLYVHSQQGVEGELQAMRYHRGYRAFYLRVERLPHVNAGVVTVTAVARVGSQEARRTETIRF